MPHRVGPSSLFRLSVPWRRRSPIKSGRCRKNNKAHAMKQSQVENGGRKAMSESGYKLATAEVALVDQATGSFLEVLCGIDTTRPDFLWRSHRSSRLFSRGIRSTQKVDRRAKLRRPRRALPVPARASQQSGQHRDRYCPRASAWRPRRVDWALLCRQLWRSSLSRLASALLRTLADAGWLHGLKVVAVAVVAQAVWGMARSLCPDRERASIAIIASIVTLAWPTAIGQLSSIAIAGMVGLDHLSGHGFFIALSPALSNREKIGIAAWSIFFALLVGLPLVTTVEPAMR